MDFKALGRFKGLWRLALVALLTAFLIKRQVFDLNQVISMLKSPALILAGVITMMAQVFLFSIRWRVFVNLFSRVSLTKIVELHFIGLFFNYYVPSGVGGDIIKVFKVADASGISKPDAFSTVLSDRIFGLYSMILFSSVFLALAYIFDPKSYLLTFLFPSLLFLGGSTLALLFLPLLSAKLPQLAFKRTAIIEKILKFTDSATQTFQLFRDPRVQLRIIGLNLGLKISSFLFIYFVISRLGLSFPPLPVFFSLCCFGLLASSIPVFPAGVGVGQYVFYMIFSNVSSEFGTAAVTAVTLLQFFNLLFALAGGILFSLQTNEEGSF